MKIVGHKSDQLFGILNSYSGNKSFSNVRKIIYLNSLHMLKPVVSLKMFPVK